MNITDRLKELRQQSFDVAQQRNALERDAHTRTIIGRPVNPFGDPSQPPRPTGDEPRPLDPVFIQADMISAGVRAVEALTREGVSRDVIPPRTLVVHILTAALAQVGRLG